MSRFSVSPARVPFVLGVVLSLALVGCKSKQGGTIDSGTGGLGDGGAVGPVGDTGSGGDTGLGGDTGTGMFDSDGDGLPDWVEDLLGTDPYNPDTDGDGLPDGDDSDPKGIGAVDTDGDGLSDDDEVSLGSDPNDPDSDHDGVNDLDEFKAGTDPLDADSDDDGLTDGQESTLGTDPNQADSDGDGMTDKDEVDAGSDPLDAGSLPSGLVNQAVTCEGVEAVTANHFADRDFYADGDYYSGAGGTECHCTVTLHDTRPTPVTGITVWMPTSVYDATDWAVDPRPKAVAVLVPWLEGGADDGVRVAGDSPTGLTGTETEVNDGYLLSGAAADHWFAFNDVPDIDDLGYWSDQFAGRADVSSAAAVDIHGTYDVYVSFVSAGGYAVASRPGAAGACAALEGDLDGDGAPDTPLRLRVDYDPHPLSLGPPPLPVATPPSGTSWLEDAVACTPGATATTRFALVDPDGSGKAVPLAVGGAAAYAYGELRQATVADWQGADRLVLRAPDGAAWATLSPETPTADLAPGLWLGQARWRSSRSTTGSYSDPQVLLTTQCPATRPPDGPAVAPSWPLSWSQADTTVQALSGGLDLATLWPGHVDLSQVGSWPSLLVRVRPVPLSDGTPGWALELEAHGVGRLAGLPLSADPAAGGGADGWPLGWTFDHTGAQGHVAGSVGRSGTGLHLALSAGQVNTAAGTLQLQPGTLDLSEYPHGG